MNLLADAGLLEQTERRGYYRITDIGEQYILGQLEKEELEELDPEE